MLDKEKARLKNDGGHPSWLRLYAIRLEKGAFIVTGGAIKAHVQNPVFEKLKKLSYLS